MVVPVVLGASTFDFNPMRSEQARLSRSLVLPSPRDKDDTSMVMELEDNPVGGASPDRVPFKYPTFVKVHFDKTGALPIFELWMKDNFDQEYKISKEHRLDPQNQTAYINVAPALNTTQQINFNPLIGGGPHDGTVNNNFAINPMTGEVFRNAYWDQGRRTIVGANGVNQNGTHITTGNPGVFQGDLVGTIKFDGITGLGLAAINTRIADISNAIEGVTKVLSVASGNMDAVIQLVR